MVVVARSPEDVAEVVKFVKMEDVELSVRSGGHSYACTSSRVTRPASFLGLRNIKIMLYV